MSMKLRRFLCLLTALLLINGCTGKEDGKKYPSEYKLSPSPKMPELHLSGSPGEQVAVDSSGLVQINYSNTSSGYLQAKFLHKPEKRMRLQIMKDGVRNIAYDFAKENEYEAFPFEQGSGIYLVGVLKNRSGETYTITLTLSVGAKLENERISSLYPNQTVNYGGHIAVAKRAFDLTKDGDTVLKWTATLHNYVVDNVNCDSKKTKEIENIYMFPAMDKTLGSKKGICFDYAVLLVTMLCSQQIPTRLVTGNTTIKYYTRVEVYIEGEGWTNPDALLYAEKRSRMDPIFDVSDIDYKDNYEDEYYYQEESGMTHTALRSEEMFDFCTQMSMILADGLSVEKGLEAVGDDTGNPYMREAVVYLLEEVHVIGSFSAALEKAPYFDMYAKKMVEIGEISGHPGNTAKELALYYECSSDLKQSSKEVLTYPSILLLMMWATVGIIVWKAPPIFEKVLLYMGVILQGTTVPMMRFGQLFATASFIILTLFLLGGILLTMTFRKPGGKSFLSYLSTIKRLYYNMIVAKMTYALSLFITSGYEMEEALGYLMDVVGDEVIQKKIDACRSDMQEGRSFSQCLCEQVLCQGVYASTIIAGFHSGESDKVMQKVSTPYERGAGTSISTFLSTIESVIVIVLSIIVGIILLSVMLPLMSIMSPVR